MNKKLPIILLSILGVIALMVAEFFLINHFVCNAPENDQQATIETTEKPKAMMLLIEFRNTDGLANMVNDMKERDIKGILMVNADFVEANQEAIKQILDTGVVEIAASYDPKPYWEMTYDEQYETISDMVTRIEEMLDTKVRIISSRYMASDENTVKIADELGIEYITARGTTELATTVYKPDEYDVKIISVSNIDTVEFKYGSFCDYSYYERSGNPEDMEKDYLRAMTNDKFLATSHTYIGGYKARWNDMWHNFWDNYEVDWVDLDTLGTVDKEMPMWQIPINKNAPYTPEKIRPLIPYDEEENVVNPCLVEDLNSDLSSSTDTSESSETNTEDNDEISVNADTVVIFHNNSGSMCLEALAFFEENGIAYEEHINTESDYSDYYNAYKATNSESEGISENYGYYPFIFYKGRAFSGFDADIESSLSGLLGL